MKKVVLTFGIIAGVIVSGMMFLTLGGGKEIDFDNGELLGYASMIIAFSTIFFGIKSYRDKNQGGSIKFGKAFLIGLYITLIASAMYVVSWEIVSDDESRTNMMEQYAAHTVKSMQDNGAPQAEIDLMVVEMKDMGELYKTLWVRILFTLMEILPVGLLVTIICAAILRRKEQGTPQDVLA